MRLPVVDGDSAKIDEEPAERLVVESVEKGITYVDTAWPYHGGTSEPFVGKVLEKNRLRDRVSIATKLPCWEVQTTADFDRLLGAQLEKLRTERIDFYLLHALNGASWNRMKGLGATAFLDRALADGRIRYAGFSFHGASEDFNGIVDGYDFAFCQIQYSYMDEQVQAGTAGLEYAASRGLGVVIMEPLRGGNLAGRMPGEIAELWNGHPVKRTPAQWALRWIWNHPGVSVVLSGMNALEQLEENVQAAAEGVAQGMSSEELDLVARVRERFRERIKIPCTGCRYCMPCPQGVNIPRIFSIYNDLYLYDDRFWSGMMYTFNTTSDEQATNCVECGACEDVCPQQIAIAERLRECHQELSQPLPGF